MDSFSESCSPRCTARLTADGFDMPILTRSGGFGSERALFDLDDSIERLRRLAGLIQPVDRDAED